MTSCQRRGVEGKLGGSLLRRSDKENMARTCQTFSAPAGAMSHLQDRTASVLGGVHQCHPRTVLIQGPPERAALAMHTSHACTG